MISKTILAHKLIVIAKQLVEADEEETTKVGFKPIDLSTVKDNPVPTTNYIQEDFDKYKKTYNTIREAWQGLQEKVNEIPTEYFKENHQQELNKSLLEFSKILVDRLKELKEDMQDLDLQNKNKLRNQASVYASCIALYTSAVAQVLVGYSKLIVTASRQQYQELLSSLSDLKEIVDQNKKNLTTFFSQEKSSEFNKLLSTMESLITQNKQNIEDPSDIIQEKSKKQKEELQEKTNTKQKEVEKKIRETTDPKQKKLYEDWLERSKKQTEKTEKQAEKTVVWKKPQEQEKPETTQIVVPKTSITRD